MSIVFSHVGFEWPTGHVVFQGINLSLVNKIYALVGPNGVGKTTLARIIVGELNPSKGTIARIPGSIILFQQSAYPPPVTIEEFLADGPGRYAYAAVVMQLLGDLPLERSCVQLSGGEWTRVRLAKAVASGAGFIILDEPTNHLDREGRWAVRTFLERYSGGVLLISHDRKLLTLAGEILELSGKGLSVFGGCWTEYLSQREAERDRLEAELAKAKQARAARERDRHEKLMRQEKRARQGKEDGIKSNLPKIIRGARKRAAQVTLGKIDVSSREEVDCAVRETWEAYQSLKVDPVMYARLPQPQLSSGRLIMEASDFNFRYLGASRDLFAQDLNFAFRTPARVVIRGANGSGKSTLLKCLFGQALRGVSRGHLKLGPRRAVYLSQEHTLLDEELSVLENVRERGRVDETEGRALLAMFLFAADRVHQTVSTLSGGERLRAALAKALIAMPPAELLVLDEPTNNLDLPNIEFLERFLRHYKGSLVVVSHDQVFLDHLDPTDEVELMKRHP
ncbi:MAG: ATP-binding cassette domain-containing protein [Bdellovibrionales bacterium]